MESLKLAAVGRCTDKPALEGMFKKYNILTSEEKISALIEIMGNPEIFYSRGNPTVEEQYDALTGAFLSGIWKRDAV
jgi:hypothetical protein